MKTNTFLTNSDLAYVMVSNTGDIRFSQKLIPYISQQRFPRFWLIFQILLGCTFDKQRLATKYYKNQKNVLEIGCSVGNISKAFTKFLNIDYLGIDIDKSAIQYAKKRFKHLKNFNFENCSLEDLVKHQRKKFDYILFSAILHHVSDIEARELIKLSSSLLSTDGLLVITDPLIPKKYDGLVIHFYHNVFEQGSNVRNKEEIEKMIHETENLQLLKSETKLLVPFLFPQPKCMRFVTIVAKQR